MFLEFSIYRKPTRAQLNVQREQLRSSPTRKNKMVEKLIKRDTKIWTWKQETIISIFRQAFPLTQAVQIFSVPGFKRSYVVTTGRKKCVKLVRVHRHVKIWTDILGPYGDVSCLLWPVCISWDLNNGSEHVEQLWNYLLTPSIWPSCASLQLLHHHLPHRWFPHDDASLSKLKSPHRLNASFCFSISSTSIHGDFLSLGLIGQEDTWRRSGCFSIASWALWKESLWSGELNVLKNESYFTRTASCYWTCNKNIHWNLYMLLSSIQSCLLENRWSWIIWRI